MVEAKIGRPAARRARRVPHRAPGRSAPDAQWNGPLKAEIPNLRRDSGHGDQKEDRQQVSRRPLFPTAQVQPVTLINEADTEQQRTQPKKLRMRYPWLSWLTSARKTFPIATASSTSACQRRNAEFRQKPAPSRMAPNSIKNAEYVNCAYMR